MQLNSLFSSEGVDNFESHEKNWKEWELKLKMAAKLQCEQLDQLEEKSIRIMEVLLSSVSPNQLMSGKIWGIAATGLTMVLSWVGFALLGVWLAPMILGDFDFPLMAVIGDPRYTQGMNLFREEDREKLVLRRQP